MATQLFQNNCRKNMIIHAPHDFLVLYGRFAPSDSYEGKRRKILIPHQSSKIPK